ncbi:phosphoenolpyruvate--protein phosphotransferase [Streptomyces wuyuanensis]|uniref:Phosphoenolpyruvate-protein phosphotransferase n=1 Tax=Streptomyces wuyuanensis TaxID=1196353 RepID=A0A1H0A1T5_9ACTN|nr:phosphoenolpyruvate--protein phosphotransferase [Streptomyces wuyuanensis]SDN27254.1 phosphotransferase system, enzyme I, PtsI [Streptomyces wuyuanensis]
MSPTSITMTGYGVSPGVACAPLARMTPPVITDPDEAPGENSAHEVQRVRQALTEVAAQLSAIATGGTAGAILEAGAAMAGDPALVQAAAHHIGRGVPTAHSLSLAIDAYCTQLEQAGGYMAERAADLRDIRNRTVALLMDVPMPGIPRPGHSFILAAEDLSPADTAQLAGGDVVGLITEKGGPTGHTAILARALGLPAVVGCPQAGALQDGIPVLLDGRAGTVEAHPSPQRRQQALDDARTRTQSRTKGPGRTADHQAVQLLTNIGTPADAVRAAQADNEGVGLFRTEFLFLDRREPPTLEEQIRAYSQVFDSFEGRTVTVRTLDAGSDKPLPFLHLPREDNPALGLRGLRTATLRPGILETQLAALVTAQRRTSARMRVMAPMVTTAEEAAHFAGLARSCGVQTVGIMIEVPSAALRAHDLLPHVDFASIGTNDLAQYSLAADRTSQTLGHLLDPWQPALLTLVATVCGAAEDLGRPVGVCGEAAADPLLAPVLAGLGVSGLSMAAPAVADVRDALAELTLEQCRSLAAAVLDATSSAAARATAREMSKTLRAVAQNGEGL